MTLTTRTFLLVLAALVVAEGIGLTLVITRPPLRNAPLSIEQLARELAPPLPAPAALDLPREAAPPGSPPPPRPSPPPAGEWRADGPRPDPPRQELRVEELATAPARIANADDTASRAVAAQLAARLGVPPGAVVAHVPRAAILGGWPERNLDAHTHLGQGFVAARRLENGRWRTATSVIQPFPNPFHRQVLWLTAAGLLLLLPLAWLFARALSAPLRRFAEGAQRLGRDPTAAPLPATGPREMRQAVEAFNAMQSRVQRLLQERTQMIAAIAHDLRTPLTRLAFRLEGLPAPLNEKVGADIQEMKAMISATLEFLRDQSTQGERERLDLRLLIERIVDDHTDLGHDVTLAAGAPVIVEGVPLALRRLVVNLVENALKYGVRARLRLQTLDGHAVLEIDDDGPGIPEAQRDRVFEPFVRLETSRNRDTGGIGLGLATVRAIVRDHGGEITLGNRAGGGLRVSVRLPLP